MENEINQLVLDCMAKALRINQTTPCSINFEMDKYGIMCWGYKRGYDNTPKIGEYPEPDFVPIGDGTCFVDKLYISEDIATCPGPQLRALLASLNALEKELLTNA